MRAAGGPDPGKESGPADGPSPLLPLQGRRLGAGPGQNLGPPGLGLSRGRRWRAPSVALELGSPGPEVGLRGGIGGGDVEDACCAQFFVGFLFCFLFLKKKKKKKKSLVSTGSVCVSCCAATGRGGQTERSPAAPRRRLLGERRIVRGSGRGAGDCELLPPAGLFSREQMDPYAGGGKGAPRVPLGSGQVCPPSLSGQAPGSLAVPISWCSPPPRTPNPESGLRAVRTGRSWGVSDEEAGGSNRTS